MREIARITKQVLANTTATTIASGKQAGQQSRVKFDLDPAIAADARQHIEELLEPLPALSRTGPRTDVRHPRGGLTTD